MGGAEAALLAALVSIREAKPEWKLDLIVSENGPLAAKAKALGVTIRVLPFPSAVARLGDSALGRPEDSSPRRASVNSMSRFRLLRQLLFANNRIRVYAASLRRILRELEPDVIHSNGFKMHILGALAKPKQVPLIWHVHDYVRQRPLMASLMKLCQRRCKIALANSKSVALDMQATCGNILPIQTIYNGIDTEIFSPIGERLNLDSLSGLPPPASDVIRIGMVATFARWKGHEVFLRALSLLPRELPWRGYIVGDALYQTEGSQYSLSELKAIARQAGIVDRMGFCGFVDQPAAAMRSLDMVVHASTEPEPFGLVIIEGMACGRAVIASEAGGAAELFDSDLTALGHPPGDAAQLAERIMQLATDPDLRVRLGAAGRASVEQRFNRSRLAKELNPIYESVRRQSTKQIREE
ncbi:MAG TPA: glycosyltransferase family 4 protein [Pyrinomonadaceae bacterium]|jgi:glycosyltransferase involved in cell wall biosynthesis